jgi:hypothetical protein
METLLHPRLQMDQVTALVLLLVSLTPLLPENFVSFIALFYP